MELIRATDTEPEMIAKRLVHGVGYRYRLHRRGLPGTPDLVFPSRSKATFVHGCFRHWHQGCPQGRMPKSRTEFWGPKLVSNRRRDARNCIELKALGWGVLVIWECGLKNRAVLAKRLRRFLNGGETR